MGLGCMILTLETAAPLLREPQFEFWIDRRLAGVLRGPSYDQVSCVAWIVETRELSAETSS